MPVWDPVPALISFPGTTERRAAGGGIPNRAPPAISGSVRLAHTFLSYPVLARFLSLPEVTPLGWGPWSLLLPVSPSPSRSYSPLFPAGTGDRTFCLHPSCLSRSS